MIISYFLYSISSTEKLKNGYSFFSLATFYVKLNSSMQLIVQYVLHTVLFFYYFSFFSLR